MIKTAIAWISVKDLKPEDFLPTDSPRKEIRVLAVVKTNGGKKTIIPAVRAWEVKFKGQWDWIQETPGARITHWVPELALPND